MALTNADAVVAKLTDAELTEHVDVIERALGPSAVFNIGAAGRADLQVALAAIKAEQARRSAAFQAAFGPTVTFHVYRDGRTYGVYRQPATNGTGQELVEGGFFSRRSAAYARDGYVAASTGKVGQ